MIIAIIILIILIILCLAYYAACVSFAGFGSSFLFFWPLLAFVFAAIIVLIILQHRVRILSMIPKIIKVSVFALILAGTLFFSLMEGLVISGMSDTAHGNAEYLVVLGAQVRGTRITRMLRKRLEAAKEYQKENPDTIIICTGGQGTGEDISEAEAMKKWFIEEGIDEEKIITEEKSTSTYENLKFSMNIIDDSAADIVVVTNNFHVYRAKKLAGNAGFSRVSAIAAESEDILLLNYMVREAFALAKELVLGR